MLALRRISLLINFNNRDFTLSGARAIDNDRLVPFTLNAVEREFER